jgi:Arc/MetJ family transcription regulator
MQGQTADRRIAGLQARRAIVDEHMRELMEAMGRADRFDNPDDWMDAMIERPLLPVGVRRKKA